MCYYRKTSKAEYYVKKFETKLVLKIVLEKPKYYAAIPSCNKSSRLLNELSSG